MDLTRGLSAPQLAALAGPVFPVLFVHADWPDDPVYAHTGTGTISWGGHDWLGVGALGGVDVPSEGMGSVATAEAILSLAGVPVDLDGRVDDIIRGRAVQMYLGFMTGRPDATTTLIGTPVDLFAGTMDGLDLDASVSGTDVEHQARVTVATGPGARSMASISHSDEDQRRLYPTDSAGRLVILSWAKAQKLTWPQT